MRRMSSCQIKIKYYILIGRLFDKWWAIRISEIIADKNLLLTIMRGSVGLAERIGEALLSSFCPCPAHEEAPMKVDIVSHDPLQNAVMSIKINLTTIN
jgi:hypothetical protein